MSINDYRPQELAEHRKRVSDKKNDTDELTFTSPKKQSSHGEAAKENRDRRDELSIAKLMRRTDEDDLLEYDLND